MKNKYYAVITPNVLGIFTNWTSASALVTGTKNSQHKSFPVYEDAKQYIVSELSPIDIIDFGLDRCSLFLNKKFVRKAQFIADKEAHSRQV